VCSESTQDQRLSCGDSLIRRDLETDPPPPPPFEHLFPSASLARERGARERSVVLAGSIEPDLELHAHCDPCKVQEQQYGHALPCACEFRVYCHNIQGTSVCLI
jgi:hypothetical protein